MTDSTQTATTPPLRAFGVWTSSRQWPRDPGEAGEAAAEVEDLGFGAVWLGGSRADLALPETLLAATRTLVVATGIVDVWSNPAADVAASHHRLTRTYPGRFVLGLGSGHAKFVETTGQRYLRPLSKLAAYLDELAGVAAPVPPAEVVLAALGPKALQLSAERTAGAHPYNVTPEHTAAARAQVGPGPVLAAEHKAFLGTDTTTARAVGRRALAIYLDLPNYLANFRRMGFDEADFADGGSDRFVDAFVAWGHGEAVAARLREHLDAGACHVPVQVLSTSDRAGLPRAEWRALAPVLVG